MKKKSIRRKLITFFLVLACIMAVPAIVFAGSTSPEMSEHDGDTGSEYIKYMWQWTEVTYAPDGTKVEKPVDLSLFKQGVYQFKKLGGKICMYIAIVSIAAAGIMIITGGDQTREKAKKMIFYALSSVLGMFILVQFIALGASIGRQYMWNPNKYITPPATTNTGNIGQYESTYINL